jgi:riboflavin kinase/FMN adenylyltransferase
VVHGALAAAAARHAQGPRPAVTLGFFDGAHRGHQAVLAATVAQARAAGGDAVVVTFDPHPRAVLAGEAPPLLTPTAERLRWFEVLGIATTVVLPFDRALAAEPARDFAERVFARALRAAAVVVGARTRFGQGGRGTPADLVAWGPTLGFATTVVPAVIEGGEPVSSTRIRDRVRRGDLRGAAELLGHPVALVGTVVHGAARGRGLGFPTANLDCAGCLVPPDGVYAGRAWLGAVAWPAVANLGTAPTFAGPGAAPRRVEVHLIGWSGDCYGQLMRFEIARKLRDERRFESVEALRLQIAADIEAAEAYAAEP